MLDKLEKKVCRAPGPRLAASLEQLADHGYIANLICFHRYYFGICAPGVAKLVPHPYSQRRSIHHSSS